VVKTRALDLRWRGQDVDNVGGRGDVGGREHRPVHTRRDRVADVLCVQQGDNTAFASRQRARCLVLERCCCMPCAMPCATQVFRQSS